MAREITWIGKLTQLMAWQRSSVHLWPSIGRANVTEGMLMVFEDWLCSLEYCAATNSDEVNEGEKEREHSSIHEKLDMELQDLKKDFSKRRFSLRCRCCHSLVAERRAQPWLHNPFKDHWWICSSLFIFWVMFIFYHSRILGLRVSWVWAFIMELHNYLSSEVEILVMWSWK